MHHQAVLPIHHTGAIPADRILIYEETIFCGGQYTPIIVGLLQNGGASLPVFGILRLLGRLSRGELDDLELTMVDNAQTIEIPQRIHELLEVSVGGLAEDARFYCGRCSAHYPANVPTCIIPGCGGTILAIQGTGDA